MIDEATLSILTPENAATYAAMLVSEDTPVLIDRLSSSEDKIRYPAFLLLREHSIASADVYPYWTILAEKLKSANSYQRSLGAMLIAENARHDNQGFMRQTLPDYLALLEDEKPITARQSAQALRSILVAQPELADTIAATLLRVDLAKVKETMRKLLLTDFIEVLLQARSIAPNSEIDTYLLSALSGSILDDKSKKSIRSKL